MKLLVDGVCFQLGLAEHARVWVPMLAHLARLPEIDLHVLDRGGVPSMPGLKAIPFPSYKHLFTADDSLLIQKICDHFAIDVFVSTFYTTPVATPSVCIIDNMIPEREAETSRQRIWREKQIALSFAQRVIACSETTRAELLRLYPDIAPEHVTMCYPAVVPEPSSSHTDLRDRWRARQPFVLVAASPRPDGGASTAPPITSGDLAEPAGLADLALLALDDGVLSRRRLARGFRTVTEWIAPADLAAAYESAHALFCPVMDAGFGLPVLEALAYGCPVIGCGDSVLAELAGGAYLSVDPAAPSDIAAAFRALRDPAIREDLVARGRRRTQALAPGTFVEALVAHAIQIDAAAKTGAFSDFFKQWRGLREMQASVDIDFIN